MPSATTHRKLSMYFIGQYTPWLHHLIDPPALTKEIKAQHRLLFHDWDFVMYLEKKEGHEVAREALLHIIVDIEQYRATERKLLKIPEGRIK